MYTYGIGATGGFRRGIHPPEKYDLVGGCEVCKDIFLKFVTIGEVLHLEWCQTRENLYTNLPYPDTSCLQGLYV